MFDHSSELWGFWEKLGGWCLLRPDTDRRDRYNKSKPLPVIGNVSEAEIEALNGTCERAHMAFGWVLRAIGRRSQQGGINASPPVFSRVYQVLSDGMTGYNNAVKLHDTPFPFPYSQFIFFNLILFSLTVPWVVSAKLGDNKGVTADWGSKVVCCVVSFMIVLVYFALNEVARDLEDPFNHDPNELPLVVMQRNFNQRIQALMAKEGYEVEAGVLDINTGILSSRQPEALIQQTLKEVAKAVEEPLERIRASTISALQSAAAAEGELPLATTQSMPVISGRNAAPNWDAIGLDPEQEKLHQL